MLCVIGRKSSAAWLSAAHSITQGSRQDSGPRIEGAKGTGRVTGWKIGGRQEDVILRQENSRKEGEHSRKRGRNSRKVIEKNIDHKVNETWTKTNEMNERERAKEEKGESASFREG